MATISTKITKVIASDNFNESEKRVTCIVESDKVKHLDANNKVEETNQVSFNPAQILNLSDDKITGDEFSIDVCDVLNYKSLGRPVKREIWGALLKNSVITFEQTKHNKGEKRQNGEDYTKDCFVTEIKSIEFAEIRPVIKQMLQKDLEQPFENSPKKAEATTPIFRSATEIRL